MTCPNRTEDVQNLLSQMRTPVGASPDEVMEILEEWYAYQDENRPSQT